MIDSIRIYADICSYKLPAPAEDSSWKIQNLYLGEITIAVRLFGLLIDEGTNSCADYDSSNK